MSSQVSPSDTTHDGKLIIVDDEQSILSALKRLFFDQSYQIHCFDNAVDALQHCQDHGADVVISDVRMPDMDGIQLQSEVAALLPHSERILLTGYSDRDSTINAINKGHISYYLEKPWDDDQLRRVTAKGMELAQSRQQNQRLKDQIQAQNEELKEWNSKLESRVLERTEELRETYLSAFQAFSSLIETRLSEVISNPRDIALLTRRIGIALQLDKETLTDLRIASLLCQLGKLGLPDDLLKTPFYSLTKPQHDEFCQHPLITTSALMMIPRLTKVASIIKQHRERIDSKGYPNHVGAENVANTAQVLHLVLLYEEAKLGLLYDRHYTHNEAIDYIQTQSEKAFTSQITDKAVPILQEWAEETAIPNEASVQSHQLKADMIVAKDLYGPNNMLILPKYKTLDQSLIEALVRIEKNLGCRFEIFVLHQDLAGDDEL